MEASAQKNTDAFGYYLGSMLKQLSGIFPECVVTRGLSDTIEQAVRSGDRDTLNRFMQQWAAHMDTAEISGAIENNNITFLLGCNVPIFEMMQIRDKTSDARLSANSKETLMRFVKTLHRIAVPVVSSEITFPPLQGGGSSSADIMDQMPPEMTPLINMARSFIQKMPEDEVEQMFGNIASIGQTVLRNYETGETGSIPPELGGDYFTDILKKTFR